MMGACYFCEEAWTGRYDSIKDAFDGVTEYARWFHGHGGYTGTIAEKGSYVVRNNGKPVPESRALDFTDEDGDSNDKWGPAYAIYLCKSEDDPTITGWMFYGWASS